MTNLQENIRNIIFYYIKQKYTNILQDKKNSLIEREELVDMVDNLYNTEKGELQQYIRDCLKDMMLDQYNSPLVENIIFEIFDDEELAKNRVILEIENYQQFKKSKNYTYEVEISQHPKYGIGLKLDFEPNDIVVSNFKRNPENNTTLPAEEKNISIGDSIIEINDVSLENINSDKSIEIIKQYLENNSNIKLKLKTYHQVKHNNQIEDLSFSLPI